MTLYGLVEALQGPGLGFNRLIAPFQLSRDALDLTDARAFSASLGMTAKGRIDLARHTHRGRRHDRAGLFLQHAARQNPADRPAVQPRAGRRGVRRDLHACSGPLADPAVSVNPLAALTPGFLRGVFGIFDGLSGGGTPAD